MCFLVYWFKQELTRFSINLSNWGHLLIRKVEYRFLKSSRSIVQNRLPYNDSQFSFATPKLIDSYPPWYECTSKNHWIRQLLVSNVCRCTSRLGQNDTKNLLFSL